MHHSSQVVSLTTPSSVTHLLELSLVRLRARSGTKAKCSLQQTLLQQVHTQRTGRCVGFTCSRSRQRLLVRMPAHLYSTRYWQQHHARYSPQSSAHQDGTPALYRSNAVSDTPAALSCSILLCCGPPAACKTVLRWLHCVYCSLSPLGLSQTG